MAAACTQPVAIDHVVAPWATGIVLANGWRNGNDTTISTAINTVQEVAHEVGPAYTRTLTVPPVVL